MNLKLADTFNVALPADPDQSNTSRQVHNSAFSFVNPASHENASLIHANKDVAAFLGIQEEEIKKKEFIDFVTGTELLPGSKPYAMCYGGHQFGNWAGQLGDGRAINLAEVAFENKSWAIQLKGAGRTPYSRTADGLAVLRSSIREHLCSEAMFHLGVPTTRSLSLSLSGNEVLRDVLYNGNSAMEKGAIVARVAPSFIRFGNFEIFAARGEKETQKKLVDYTINQFFPEIKSGTKEGYLEFFKTVTDQTLNMIVHWQRVGFVHGVMNTDNMSILGLTIDYGPYGWLEGYDQGWTPNTTDIQNKRYRFGNQPQIAMWNLYQLANALFSLIENESALQETLNQFNSDYHEEYLKMMRSKLGLFNSFESDIELITDLENILQLIETDMTLFFRNLASFSKTQVFESSRPSLAPIMDAFYSPNNLSGNTLKSWLIWFSNYHQRLQLESKTDEERAEAMNKVNPKYVLRNYMAQLVIDEADKGNYELLNEISELLKNPYSEQETHQKWFAKRPDWARNKVGCSMLSCSS